MENKERTSYSNLNSAQKLGETASNIQYKNEYTFLNNTRESNMFERYTVQLNGIIGCYKSGLPSIHKSHTNRSSFNSVDGKVKKLQNIVSQKIKQDHQLSSLYHTQRQTIPRSFYYQYPHKSPQIQYIPIYGCFPFQQTCSPQNNQPQLQQNKEIVCHKIEINQTNSNDKLISKTGTTTKGIRPKRKLKKLKIYVYIVYFCIYFPQYSKKFAEQRRNYVQSYHMSGKLPEVKLFKCLQKIDLYKIKKQSLSDKQAQMILDWEQLTNTALIPKQSKTQTEINVTDLVCKQLFSCTENFLVKVLSKLSQQKKDKIDQLYRKLSLLISNNSVIMSDAYYQQQAHIMTANKQGNMINLSKEHQIQLILTRIVYKMIIEKFLENITKNANYIEELKQKHRIQKFQISSMEKLIKNIKLYLFIIYKQIYTKFISKNGKKSNFVQFARKNEINFINSKWQQDYKCKINKDVQFATLFRKKQVEEFEIFINKSKQLQISKQKIKQTLDQICIFIHDRIYDQKYMYYEQIKVRVLGQKNLISKKPMITNLQVKQQKMNQKRKKLKFELCQNLHKIDEVKQNISILNKEQQSKESFQRNKIENKIGKLAQNKKNEFSLDVVNSRYRERRQDQIRQRFRNILNKK